jgi:energy-coupling factor transport system ATP-binding protein
MTAFEAKDITFSYGDRPLLSGVSLSVETGECVALTGPSGCGKSTLCYILSGIIPRSIEGSVGGRSLLFGDDVSSLPLKDTVERVGIVFQNPDAQLFSPVVEDEIAFGPENLCLPREEIGRRIDDALSAVGMEDYRYAGPGELSGGQRQLIALAAVLACRPKALIFDEALSQLDDETTLRIKRIILRLKEGGCAILMVEHDQENLDIADRVYAFCGGTICEVPHE